jgi:hypothetical protein
LRKAPEVFSQYFHGGEKAKLEKLRNWSPLPSFDSIARSMLSFVIFFIDRNMESFINTTTSNSVSNFSVLSANAYHYLSENSISILSPASYTKIINPAFLVYKNYQQAYHSKFSWYEMGQALTQSTLGKVSLAYDNLFIK